MKRLLATVLLLVVFMLFSVLGCRGWPEMNNDVKELRSLHAIYRGATVPKHPTESATVENLAVKLDEIMGHLDKLTR